jgi:multimeric flavodoxin WrbA
MSGSKHLLIVYHSRSGTTRRIAEAVIKGARHPDIANIDVRVRDALEATPDDLLWADGLILGTPENFGYMSGAMKYFLDRIYYPCEDKVTGLPYALFIRAGNDGSGAADSVNRILSGLKVKQIHEPLLMVGEFDASRLSEFEELGMLMAAGLESEIF